nr:hypothetical protein [Tanacetum cinerariifolium]
MTGNKAYLADYQEFKGDSVAFGGSNHSGSGKNWSNSGNHITASGNSSSRGPAVGIKPLPVGTSATPLDKTVAASMEVNTVSIFFVSSLTLSTASSPTSNHLPLIGASSLDRSVTPHSLSSNSLSLAFNMVEELRSEQS